MNFHPFADEPTLVQTLLREAAVFKPHTNVIERAARSYIDALRMEKPEGGIEAFQQEYGLDSDEGIRMMCLAEALLRIPDKKTADKLIQDKLTDGEWDKHIGFGRPWFLNVSGVGLGLAEKVVAEESTEKFLGRLIRRLGEGVVRAALKQAMKLMGNVFVLAPTIEKARERAGEWHEEGYLLSYDMLGEGARSAAQAEAYFLSYLHAVKSFSASSGHPYQNDSISIKLTALHPRLELRKWETLERELLPKLKMLVVEAKARNVMVTIDAEEANRLDVTLKLFARLYEEAAYEELGIAVQAYQKRAVDVIAFLAALAEKTGGRIPVRLVKGAYWDSEIKRVQMDGLPDYPVFTRKYHTDVSYLACAKKLLEKPEQFYPQFATHNARTIASLLAYAPDHDYEFQRLHGMGEALYREVRKTTDKSCRIYAPVGSSESLLSYLIRRILENGANSSFVHGVMNTKVPVSELISDPIALSRQSGGRRHESIPLPGSLYGDRENSEGLDLGYEAHLKIMQQRLDAWPASRWVAPSEANLSQVESAFAMAAKGFAVWKERTVDERAGCLEKLAALYEAHADELTALCVREAGKTFIDSVAEVREAVDYCRYYALQARELMAPKLLNGPTGERNVLSLKPRGIWVAISPWNFPLAIFTGQIAAALVTGNAVIAKPAEQTPIIAARAVALMQEAGIPKDVIQLLCGSGETLGAAVVAHPQVAGVVFTGSTATARVINRALAAKDGAIVPLIAETGGQNCMVVDSSALIEQSVDDMIHSAFGSAGQRCSALRVAFVQEDIADALLTVLKGAVEQLQVGDPELSETDIGPVIDADAQAMLQAHSERMMQEAKLIAKAPSAAGLYFPPHVFEIPSINVLKGEVFGPILHIVRYKAAALDDVIEAINSTGYGLTFGIQSRIDAQIELLSTCVQAGNIYVNRSMIGAVVGVQPFGGHGLSGTGPKAGGPHYLQRFCAEQTLTCNTAAIGGNIDLLK
ncbi:MAG: L-glutamate gamma-semialdehyde dehydrogenase [Rickettsiales bacterium]